VGAGDGGIPDLHVVVNGGAGIGLEAICGSAGCRLKSYFSCNPKKVQY
jgi:hypothetical protein